MNRDAQIRTERELLEKADRDIEAGSLRLREQQDYAARLHAGGRDARQAERLASLMRETLLEWERHRQLIAQRLDYLRNDPIWDQPLPRAEPS